MYGLNERDSKIIEKILEGEPISSISDAYGISIYVIQGIISQYKWRKNLYEEYIETYKLAEMLDFNARICNALNRSRRSKITNIAELVQLFNNTDILPILAIRNLGRKSISFIVNKLINNGYTVSVEILEYLGDIIKPDNIIELGKKKQEVKEQHVYDYINIFMESMTKYIKYKVVVAFDTILLSDKNLKFLEEVPNEAYLHALINEDCLKYFVDNINNYRNEIAYDMNKIDMDLNKYLKETLGDLKERYYSKIYKDGK